MPGGRLRLTLTVTFALSCGYFLYSFGVRTLVRSAPIPDVQSLAQSTATDADTEVTQPRSDDLARIAQEHFADHPWVQAADIQLKCGDPAGGDRLFYYCRSWSQTDDKRSAELEPLALLWFGAGRAEPLRIMAESAVVTFQDPVEVSRGNPGRVVEALLRGEVTIHGEDNLQVVGRDFTYTEKAAQIWSAFPVQFRFDKHQGSSGKGIQIDLAMNESLQRGAQLAVAGVSTVHLFHNVQMDFQFDDPLLVRADGSFLLRLQGPEDDPSARMTATFDRRVQVRQIATATSAVTTLDCDRLDLSLAKTADQRPGVSGGILASDTAAADGPDSSRAKSLPGMDNSQFALERMQASGNRVTLKSEADELLATISTPPGIPPVTAHVVYDAVQRRVFLNSFDPVVRQATPLERMPRVDVRLPEGTLECQQVELVQDERNELQELICHGQGELRYLKELKSEPSESPAGQAGTGIEPRRLMTSGQQNAGPSLTAQWTRQLRRFHDAVSQQDVIDVVGDATIRMPLEQSGINADFIRVWMDPVATSGSLSSRRTAAAPSAASSGQSTGGDSNRISPRRVLAKGAVRLESPELGGSMHELQVWFEDAPRGGQVTDARMLRNTYAAAGRYRLVDEVTRPVRQMRFVSEGLGTSSATSGEYTSLADRLQSGHFGLRPVTLRIESGQEADQQQPRTRPADIARNIPPGTIIRGQAPGNTTLFTNEELGLRDLPPLESASPDNVDSVPPHPAFGHLNPEREQGRNAATALPETTPAIPQPRTPQQRTPPSGQPSRVRVSDIIQPRRELNRSATLFDSQVIPADGRNGSGSISSATLDAVLPDDDAIIPVAGERPYIPSTSGPIQLPQRAPRLKVDGLESVPGRSLAPSLPDQLPDQRPGSGSVVSAPAVGNSVDEPTQVEARLVRVRILRHVDGTDPEVAEIYSEGDVHITRQDSDAAEPTHLHGDRLHLKNQGPTQQTVHVTGQPARMLDPRMKLSGNDLHVDRHRNYCWVDGPGSLGLTVTEDLEGNPLPEPSDVTITWHEQMSFDGLTATFNGRVNAVFRFAANQPSADRSGPERLPLNAGSDVGDSGPASTGSGKEEQLQDSLLSCQVMEVTLSDRLDFRTDANDSSTSASRTAPQRPRPEISRVVCQYQVEFNSFEYVRGTLREARRAQVAAFAMEKSTGRAEARGPGIVTVWTRGRGRRASLTPIAVAGANTGMEADTTDWEYTRIDFARQMIGQEKNRVLQFDGQVQLTYGPVSRPPEVINLDNLPPDGGAMSCDHLVVAQVVNGEDSFIQLLGRKNARLEGRQFNAQADEISFDQSKGLYRLRSFGDNNSIIVHEEQQGGERNAVVAQTISFTPAENRIEFDKASRVQGRQ